MSEYRPKIAKTQTNELIEIANSSTEVWQQDAINQSKSELIKRNITKSSKMLILNKKLEKLMIFMKMKN